MKCVCNWKAMMKRWNSSGGIMPYTKSSVHFYVLSFEFGCIKYIYIPEFILKPNCFLIANDDAVHGHIYRLLGPKGNIFCCC